jgi:rhamnosyltransferase
MPPLVSVAIPTRNAGKGFSEVLDRIRSQIGVGEFDIVVVDTDSTDQTREMAVKAGAKVYKIEQKDFNHGDTRNFAISRTEVEVVALLTQDALPENEHWLYALVNTVLDDPQVSGAYSRQIPHNKVPFWVRKQMEEHGVLSEEKRVQYLGEKDSFGAMSPIQRVQLCTFDNVSSAIRREAWEEHPFPKVLFAEDMDWGRGEILRGHKLIYQPNSCVIHSHRPNPFQEYARAKVAHKRLAGLFDLRLVPSFPMMIRYGISNSFRLTQGTIKKHPMRWIEIAEAPFIAMASTLGQYYGAKSVKRKRRELQ